MRTFVFLFALAVIAVAGVYAKPEDEEYLKETAARSDITKLPSGLMYEVVKSGDASGASPGASTRCDVHYAGRLIDGTEFDSSYKRGKPSTFAPNQVIKGWTEALQMMHEGDKWILHIPSDLAYGNSQRGAHIYPGATLVFDIELIKIH
eukprot:TRINITY_DN3079_c0_g1_i1.p1 TRINITY_DN3079_c0_g1~~TRINITY_DN3079_c0_g1_i1.p1  ORF type:complete len:149 (-),score=55.83 TRINITY_DN3079_c0_g1_i1:124-570(-)